MNKMQVLWFPVIIVIFGTVATVLSFVWNGPWALRIIFMLWIVIAVPAVIGSIMLLRKPAFDGELIKIVEIPDTEDH